MLTPWQIGRLAHKIGLSKKDLDCLFQSSEFAGGIWLQAMRGFDSEKDLHSFLYWNTSI